MRALPPFPPTSTSTGLCECDILLIASMYIRIVYAICIAIQTSDDYNLHMWTCDEPFMSVILHVSHSSMALHCTELVVPDQLLRLY